MLQRQEWHLRIVLANEDGNDEWDGDDLEGGEDGKDDNDDEGDHCGYLPVRSRCSGTVTAPNCIWSCRETRAYVHRLLAHPHKHCSSAGSLPQHDIRQSN